MARVAYQNWLPALSGMPLKSPFLSSNTHLLNRGVFIASKTFSSSSKITMSLKAGIVGLPNVGKSTLFNAVVLITVADLKNVYTARGIGRGRIVFRLRGKREPLVPGPESSDDDWKASWLFIEKRSMGADFDWVPELWSPKVVGWEEDPADAESNARIQAFMEIPLAERQGISAPRPAICWSSPADTKIIPVPAFSSTESQEVGKPKRAISVMEKIRLARKRGSAIVPAPAKIPVSSSKPPVPESPAKVVIDIPQKRRKLFGLPDWRSIKPSLDEASIAQGKSFVSEHSESLGEAVKSVDAVGLVMQGLAEQHKNLGYTVMVAQKVLDLQAELNKVKEELATQEQVSKDLEGALNLERERYDGEYAQFERNFKKLKKDLEDLEVEHFKNASFYNAVGRIHVLQAPPGSVTLEDEYDQFRRMFPGQEVPALEPDSPQSAPQDPVDAVPESEVVVSEADKDI